MLIAHISYPVASSVFSGLPQLLPTSNSSHPPPTFTNRSTNNMTRHTPTGVILLSTLLLQASAQLLSCLDVHCPYSYGLADCHIDNTTCTEIGVASFSSSLSPNALTWTVGWAPKVFTQSTDQRRYYLGTPQGLNLNARTDITGCAFFFTGVQAGLSFVKPNGTSVDLGAESGTCADALGSTCVFDLMGQARDLAVSPDFQCTNMAQELQSSPPQSCTKPGTWGNITAKSEFSLLYNVTTSLTSPRHYRTRQSACSTARWL